MSRNPLLTAGVLAALLAAAALIVVFVFGQGAAAVSDNAHTLALYRSELAQRPRLEQGLARLRAEEGAAPGLLQGASAPLAAADMQRLVKSVIESCGGEVRSAQNLPSSPEGGLEKIEVQYDLVLPLGQVKRALYRLETGTPYLFLDNADLKVPDGADAANSVEIQWTVRGYRAWRAP